MSLGLCVDFDKRVSSELGGKNAIPEKLYCQCNIHNKIKMTSHQLSFCDSTRGKFYLLNACREFLSKFPSRVCSGKENRKNNNKKWFIDVSPYCSSQEGFSMNGFLSTNFQ